MNILFKMTKDYICNKLERRRRFFREGRDLIAESNFRTLLRGSLAVPVLLVFFLLSTPFIIRDWHATVYHISFLPVSLSVWTMIFLVMRKKRSSRVVTAFSILFEMILFAFLILIDTAGSPDEPASFIPPALIAVPAIFTLPLTASAGLPVLCELCFIAAVLVFKEPELQQYDIFNSVFGFVCSAAVSNLIMSLRIQDYETQMKYKHMSTFDALSSILNKQTSTEACVEYLDYVGEEVVCSLMIFDLDDFKQVNDTKGHIAGDAVIRCMGEILMSSFRRSDIVGRFGGDEFVVLMKGIASRSLMIRKCETIQRELQRMTQREVGIPVSCSIGVLLVKRQRQPFELLFQQADEALYQAKKTGKGRYQIVTAHSPAVCEKN